MVYVHITLLPDRKYQGMYYQKPELNIDYVSKPTQTEHFEQFERSCIFVHFIFSFSYPVNIANAFGRKHNLAGEKKAELTEFQAIRHIRVDNKTPKTPSAHCPSDKATPALPVTIF